MELTDYNDNQQAAIKSTAQQIIVSAGAGTGKTRVLTGRFAWQVQMGLVPQEIMAITFSTMAANQMKERLAELLPEVPAESLTWVRTIHSTCLKILKEFAPPDYHPGGIVAGRARLEYAQEAVRNAEVSEKEFPVAKVIAFIDRVKMAEFPEEKLAEADQRLVKIYHVYQTRLENLKLLDFSDLIHRVRTLFDADPGVLSEIRRHIKQILVDEFQDLDPAQFALVRTLAGTSLPIFVVGDSDQSIYRFRGSYPKIFEGFFNYYQRKPEWITLNVSYRCTETILASAQRLIQHNTTRITQERMISARSEDGVVSVKGFRMPDEEVRYICSEIQKEIQTQPASQIAVLSRTKDILEAVRKGLNEAKVPIYRPSIDFYATKEFEDLSAWLQLICYPSDESALERTLMAPKRGLDEGIIGRLRDIAEKHDIPPFFALTDLIIPENLLENEEKTWLLKEYAMQYRHLRNFATCQPTRLVLIIRELLNTIGYERFLANQVPPDKLEKKRGNIQTLLDMAQGYEQECGPSATLTNFVNELALQTLTPASPDHKGVMLLTFHAAKGLEFNRVFLAGVETGVIPHARCEEIEDERRVMYVAATRAVSRLVMSWVEYRGRYRGRPSLFIQEMQEGWLEKSLFFHGIK